MVEELGNVFSFSGAEELQLLAIMFNEAFGFIEGGFGVGLGDGIERRVVPLIEEAFFVVVDEIELIGADYGD